MFFDEDYIETISKEPVEAIVKICDAVFSTYNDTEDRWSYKEHEMLIEAFAFIHSIMELNSLDTKYSPPNLSGSIQADSKALNDYLINIKNEFQAEASHIKIQSLKSQYTTALGGGFYYEFSKGDLDRVQLLISELRDVIASSAGLEKEHKSRLLKRLEKLQSELHKKVSDLDRFWGLVGDAGVALGKLGTDAKPIVDRIKEISDIIWRTQSRAEELPSNTPKPLLEDENNDNH